MPTSVTNALRPRLVVAGAARAIDYYRRALGAVELERHAGPDGTIVHAELAVGTARFTLKDADATDRAPTSAGGTPVLLMLAVDDVDDVDAVARRMVAAGGTVVFPVKDTPAGRGGRLADPFGHLWMLSQAAPTPAKAGTRADTDTEADAEADADADAGDLDRLTDLRTPWCVHVAATLRIPEHIAAGRTSAAELAAAAGCDAYALDRVLGHLVTMGVFTQPAPGRYALNDAARRLLEPARFLDLSGVGGRMAHAWSTLPGYVNTGRPHYHEVFGLPFWEDLAAHPDVAASFDALMGPAGHGTPDPHFELADGWDQVRTVVDVGGGTGAMLAELLRARPALTGTLVDLPGTVARAGATFAAAGVRDRVTVVGQSFFDPLPAGADVYLLMKVLNDWPDDETVAILRRCAEAARPGGGRIVIMGGVSPDGAAPHLTIEMVLLGGRVNTVSEFTELARRADLKVVAAGPRAAGRFVVECRPA